MSNFVDLLTLSFYSMRIQRCDGICVYGAGFLSFVHGQPYSDIYFNETNKQQYILFQW